MAKEVKAPLAKEENPISEEESKLAKDLLMIIAKSDIRLGARNKENDMKFYKESVLKMIKLLHKNNILVSEVSLMKDLMMQAVGIACNAMQGSIEMSQNIALTNYWGKHPEEIRLQDIDVKMKKKDK